MRKVPIAENEVYHLYNRGNNKQMIFHEERDYLRFLFLLVYFQSPLSFLHAGRRVSDYQNTGLFGLSTEEISKVIEKRYVDLLSFALMPNHFHAVVQARTPEGIPSYMHRVQHGFSKYYNQKYSHFGHLFQGSYGITRIADNNQLLYLSTYLHRQCREIPEWKNREERYPWSSYQDYVIENRWGDLLTTGLIKEQFTDGAALKRFTNESIAKTTLLDEDVLHPTLR